MWNEFPRKGYVGDAGIDIVAEERAKGESCAIRRALVEAVLCRPPRLNVLLKKRFFKYTSSR